MANSNLPRRIIKVKKKSDLFFFFFLFLSISFWNSSIAMFPTILRLSEIEGCLNFASFSCLCFLGFALLLSFLTSFFGFSIFFLACLDLSILWLNRRRKGFSANRVISSHSSLVLRLFPYFFFWWVELGLFDQMLEWFRPSEKQISRQY